ncbi:hypothetical protein GWK47_052106 [Chionoecetes opilio]|uniref:HAT C-terminal dimerisation domain-containing protein n=1 Tax=Chionoecetes opilio TaxID=41210 RepID=A0A8J5CAS0_CHIOP|nr:hypothetical protein GWK47_052106 [Chionoecetes opilio]
MALEALHEEAKPLGLEVFWIKTKVKLFGGLLDETLQSVHECGEDTEILESFTYLAIHPLFKLPVVLFLNPEKVDAVKSRLLFEVTEQAVLDTSEDSSPDEDEEEDFFKTLTSPGLTATEGTNSTRLSNKMGKELESWCSEKKRNKLLEQAIFTGLFRAAWVDVFVKYTTAIPSSAAVERLFSRGREAGTDSRGRLVVHLTGVEEEHVHAARAWRDHMRHQSGRVGSGRTAWACRDSTQHQTWVGVRTSHVTSNQEHGAVGGEDMRAGGRHVTSNKGGQEEIRVEPTSGDQHRDIRGHVVPGTRYIPTQGTQDLDQDRLPPNEPLKGFY